jgi:hypothetical protein
LLNLGLIFAESDLFADLADGVGYLLLIFILHAISALKEYKRHEKVDIWWLKDEVETYELND